MLVKVYPYKSPHNVWTKYLGTAEYLKAIGFDYHKLCFYLEVDVTVLDKSGRVLRKVVVNQLLSRLRV